MSKKHMPACLALLILLTLTVLAGCGGKGKSPGADFDSLTSKGKMQLDYATQFEVEYFEGGYALITIAGEDRFLLVPDGAKVPEGVDEDIKIIRKPVQSTYLAASSAMDFYRQLDSLDQVRMTSTEGKDWSFPEVQQALADEEMLFVGKYSAPDYETIVDENCGLAIESTMIYHSPEIKEKLEEMGIPVLVERSSYESEPLGRMEWIKLYGLLCDKEDAADAFFKEQTENLSQVLTGDAAGKKVAFFSVNSSGQVTVRKPGDYITKMIEMAGGTYALTSLKVDEDNALSTMKMQMEDFYSDANDADILIYNSTIEGKIETMDQLVEKNKLFKEFKAVKEGNVWCTESNTFQQTTGVAQMTAELYSVIHDEAGDGQDLTFLSRVK